MTPPTRSLPILRVGFPDRPFPRTDATGHLEPSQDHALLCATVLVLPGDYQEYGGRVERWADDRAYPDCSSGCVAFRPLHDAEGNHPSYDWGVCTNPQSPRMGLVTFEHQTGADCFLAAWPTDRVPQERAEPAEPEQEAEHDASLRHDATGSA